MPKKRSSSSVVLVSAVVRVFSILDRLSLERSVSLEELSRETRLAKPTILRFLQTLQKLGYVRRDERDQWAITFKLFTMGSRALGHLDLYVAARPVAEKLAEELGETVHMGILEADEAVYVLKIESRYTIRMFSRVGRRIPLHCTAIGKALLAFSAPAERAAVLKGLKFVAFTPKTLSSRAKLEEELEAIRGRGYTVDDEEHEEGIRCIGAPIFDYTGAVVAALSVSWPVFRFPHGGTSAMAARVMDAAARISSILGWAGMGENPECAPPPHHRR
jgi:IclR family KDG regulon transcriptional repressor